MAFKSTRRSRRNRNNPQPEQKTTKPFFQTKEDPSATPDNFFQPKSEHSTGGLKIGEPGDKYEQEADAVADAVVGGQQRQSITGEGQGIQRMPESDMEKDKMIQEMPEEEEVQMMEEEEPVQMMGEEEEVQMMEEEEEEPVQMMGDEEEEVQMMEEEELQTKTQTNSSPTASPKLAQQLQHQAGRGRAMDKNTRTQMESGIGHDFSQVNIHTDETSVQMNKELGAKAFTRGKDVYFNRGQYQPETTEGQRLLAHELTHVVQQGASGEKVQRASDIVSDEKDPIAAQKHSKTDADKDIPGLTAAVAKKLTELIAEGTKTKRKEALDVLVTFLIKDGQIDASLLQGGKMYYGTSGEGLASPPGYKKDTDTGEYVAKPTPVRIGFKAFKNVPWLYSSVMHEYMHVLQFQQNVARGTKGQRNLGWLIKRQEVEAYAYEINNAENTGVDKHPKMIKDLWKRLNDNWKVLGKSSKKLLASLYETTYQKAKKLLGDKVTLTYKPYKA